MCPGQEFRELLRVTVIGSERQTNDHVVDSSQPHLLQSAEKQCTVGPRG